MANYPGRGPNFPYKPGQFKPGNKMGKGRPRDAGLTALIREVLRSNTIRGKPIPDGKTVEEVLAEVFVAEALKGKFLFCKELMDRMEGKVPDRVQHSGHDGGPLYDGETQRKAVGDPETAALLCKLDERLAETGHGHGHGSGNGQVHGEDGKREDDGHEHEGNGAGD